MERLNARNGWIATFGVIAAYEIACPKGETLSEGVDRAMERPLSRALVLGGIAITAAHLANLLPEKADPFHYALIWKHQDGTTGA